MTADARPSQGDVKERVRHAVDLADVIAETVALKPAGKGRLKGLCPFHGERTPSFHVLTDRGFYYCFGCGAKGDVFNFVMHTRGVEFFEALQWLGARAGIEVEAPSASGAGQKRRDLVQVNEVAEAWFFDNLRSADVGREAMAYLLGRGLHRSTLDAWRIGFAPEGWDGLTRHASGAGVRDEDLFAAGLLSENDRGRRYDRFRGRIMFPIRDRLGRLVGFSGRVLGDDVPKYVNTPETDIFDKGSILYGLDVARPAIRDRGRCLVVEGYVDVLALHQMGFPYAVAALGATLTAAQADELSRLDVHRLQLAFDADDAGRRAVLAGLDQSIGRRFFVEAIAIPSGKDPADAVLGGDVASFEAALESGTSEVEYRVSDVLRAHDATSVAGRKAILEALAPRMIPRSVDDPVALEVRRRVIDALDLDERRLTAWLDGRRPGRELDAVQVRGLRKEGSFEAGSIDAIELDVIALLLGDEDRLRQRLEAVTRLLPTDAEPSRIRRFAQVCDEESFDAHRVLARYRDADEAAALFDRLFQHAAVQALDTTPADVDRHVEAAMSRLRERLLERDTKRTRRRLEERWSAGGDGPTEGSIDGLNADLAELQRGLAAREAERRLRTQGTSRRAPKRR